MKPIEIESLSFRIIDEEAGEHSFSNQEWNIVRRMIHTSADFEYMKTVRFHKDAILEGLKAIKAGKSIFTDTNMAKSGIRNKIVLSFGGDLNCLISDPEVIKIAHSKQTTRAEIAVDIAASKMDGGIYVIGNAPTALLKIISLVKKKEINPALIIGLPVGFVNAAESKAFLLNIDCPYITNTGRKGGSNIAASVINALLIMATNSETKE